MGKGLKCLQLWVGGVLLSASTHPANHQEDHVGQFGFDFYELEVNPVPFIGDGAYDSVRLDDDDFRLDGISPIVPTGPPSK